MPTWNLLDHGNIISTSSNGILNIPSNYSDGYKAYNVQYIDDEENSSNTTIIVPTCECSYDEFSSSPNTLTFTSNDSSTKTVQYRFVGGCSYSWDKLSFTSSDWLTTAFTHTTTSGTLTVTAANNSGSARNGVILPIYGGVIYTGGVVRVTQEGTTPVTPTCACGNLSVDTSSITFPATGDSTELSYSFTGDCTGGSISVSSNQTWCTATYDSNKITITAESHIGSYVRSAIISIVVNNDVSSCKTIEVTQTASIMCNCSNLDVDTTPITFPATGDSVELSYSFTGDCNGWSMSVSSSESWCTATTSNTKITISTSTYTSTAQDRSATVSIFVNGDTTSCKTIEITQSKSAVCSTGIEPSNETLPYSGGQITFTLEVHNGEGGECPGMYTQGDTLRWRLKQGSTQLSSSTSVNRTITYNFPQNTSQSTQVTYTVECLNVSKGNILIGNTTVTVDKDTNVYYRFGIKPNTVTIISADFYLIDDGIIDYHGDKMNVYNSLKNNGVMLNNQAEYGSQAYLIAKFTINNGRAENFTPIYQTTSNIVNKIDINTGEVTGYTQVSTDAYLGLIALEGGTVSSHLFYPPTAKFNSSKSDRSGNDIQTVYLQTS